ncbi:MAG TPA: SDR family NAD(P)-dependent oxidoreductase [Williamwhitmania sp.]|nr:SDR family NAD(P)-dependent oxidoreductase [Williamwhitmania sp.]
MELFIITGSSRGIGKALVEKILDRNDVEVYGLSRTNTNSHPQFHFIPVDFVSTNNLQHLSLPDGTPYSKIVLVNNAGMLGEVNHLGKLNSKTIVDVFAVNTVAPALLMNKFLSHYAESKAEKVIINISSGAGRHAIASWSTYCASKAALDMLSQTAQMEQNEVGEKVSIFSVAPGVVDTQMQAEIRTKPKESFSQIERFISLKESGNLASPESVAVLLLKIVATPDRYHEVILDLRNL